MSIELPPFIQTSRNLGSEAVANACDMDELAARCVPAIARAPMNPVERGRRSDDGETLALVHFVLSLRRRAGSIGASRCFA